MEAMALGLQEKEKRRESGVLGRIERKRKMEMLKKAGEGEKTEKDKARGVLIAEKVRKMEEEARRKVDETRRKQEKRDRDMEEREREKSKQRAKERERQRESSRQKEEERGKIAEKEEKEEAARKAREMETPQQALHRLYQPIFQNLWDMEFANLNWTNPFRIVYNASNCAAMGVPDYTEIVKQPMNLTYIREKVQKKKYETLQAFFADVDLMISNALLYNSDPSNAYHLAAKEMKKKYKKMAKRVVLSLKKDGSSK